MALYRVQPERCLDPSAEHERFKADDDTAEVRAERREARLTSQFAELDRQAEHQMRRWRRPKDILED